MSFQLITDSCSDLPVSFVEEHQIAIISMTIQL